ncbi:MAG TPA: hypothetical protein PLN44_11320 [Syntrophales bacterium]|nr:hypothetical protein [Syntrophales bacterium]HOM08375.1 hypothetical protein [Syntrophales bacterium]HOO00977.1 hypothetical protein [Syntrophales bacterium]
MAAGKGEKIPLLAAASAGLICWLSLGVSVCAHEPQEVTLKYDRSAGSLSVTVTHTPYRASSHFIREIEVKKNGRVVGKHPYTEQTEGTFTRAYPVSASSGDVLEAVATCNRYGSRSGKTVVNR